MQLNISNEIEELSQQIINEVDFDIEDASLASGSGGISLFLYYAGHFLNRTDILDRAGKFFLNCLKIKKEGNIEDYSLCGGTTGIYWLYQHYINEDFIADNEQDRKILEEYDQFLMIVCKEWANKSNYELLYGIIGAGVYYFERNKKNNVEKYLSEILDILMDISLDRNNIDIGYAHGLASLIVYFSIEYDRTKNIKIVNSIKKLVIIYREIQENTFDSCIYPCKIEDNIPIGVPSRLAWCYGDLSVAYAFLFAGYKINDDAVVQLGNDVIKKVILRKDEFNNTGVYDNCLCHGVTGISCILNKMFIITNSKEILDYRNYWISRYSFFKMQNNGNNVYIYNPQSSSSQLKTDYGFIDGLSGIGLALLSLTGDNSNWMSLILI